MLIAYIFNQRIDEQMTVATRQETKVELAYYSTE